MVSGDLDSVGCYDSTIHSEIAFAHQEFHAYLVVTRPYPLVMLLIQYFQGW